MKLTRVLKRLAHLVIRTLYPWVYASSFYNLYDRLFVIVDIKQLTFGKLIGSFMPLAWAISVITKAFLINFIPNEKFHAIMGYSSKSLGYIGRSAWMATGFALIEVSFLRVYLTMSNYKKVPGYKVLLGSLDESYPKMGKIFLFIAKMNCWSMAVFAMFLFQFLHLIPLLESDNSFLTTMCSIWIGISSIGPYYAGPDVASMFVMAIACYYVIDKRVELMINRLSNSQKITSQFLRDYIDVLNMVAEFGDCSGVMMFIADLLIMPTYSVVLYTLNITGNMNQLILKGVLFTIGSIYAVRGYVLTGIFAGIEVKSRRVHAILCSMLARNPNIHPRVKIGIRDYILEDLSSLRKHLSIREYSRFTVNQMDLLNNILGTWQLILLLFDFKNLFD